MSDDKTITVPEGPLSWDTFRGAIRQMAELTSEWAGIPMPINGEELVLESRYPYNLSELNTKPEDPTAEKFRVINQWYSRRLSAYIQVVEDEQGTRQGAFKGGRSADAIVGTLSGCYAWDILCERAALDKLATMLSAWSFKCYLLTGTFIESSKRSGIYYVFRKLRPTVAFKDSRLLCALCMHPIGYYRGTWAGVMTPTDDVIAHLTLMRGDEVLFWKRSNQIPINQPEAGL